MILGDDDEVRKGPKTTSGGEQVGMYVGTGRAAQIAGVSVDTIRRWCSAGRLPYVQGSGPGDHRRIRVEDLLDLLAGRDVEPAAPKLTHITAAKVIEGWTERLAELLPFRPGPGDSEDRLGRLLVALHGYSSDGGQGGLAGVIADLAASVELALNER